MHSFLSAGPSSQSILETHAHPHTWSRETTAPGGLCVQSGEPFKRRHWPFLMWETRNSRMCVQCWLGGHKSLWVPEPQQPLESFQMRAQPSWHLDFSLPGPAQWRQVGPHSDLQKRSYNCVLFKPFICGRFLQSNGKLIKNLLDPGS